MPEPHMRALRIDRPGKTGFVTIERPQPQPGEALIAVERIGYCGTDLATFRGSNPLVAYPRIPGHEIAGQIAAVTAGVPESIVVGARATVLPYTSCGRCSSCRSGRTNACRYNQTLGVQRDGALTEMIAVPWQKVRVSPLTFPELALVEPLSVGFHAAARGRVAAQDRVAVIGCGMIGLGAIAAAGLRYGATVIAVDVEDSKLALASRAGARHVINSRTENLSARLQELTGGDGPDVVIEAVGSVPTYQAAVAEVAFAGRVVYIGYGSAPVPYETKAFVLKELDILGSRNATATDFDAVMATLAENRYPTAATITHTVPWTDAGKALADWAAQPSAVTKIHVLL